jgi:hypothetical protein
LSDAQLEVFFRAASTQDRDNTALKFINDALDGGQRLDEFFAMRSAGGDVSERVSVELKVKRLSPRVFSITFGFHGPLVGDGGEWRVVFASNGRVLKCEPRTFWIH